MAGRGFYALERLLFGEAGALDLTEPYRCRYVAAVALDIRRLADEILAEWAGPWAQLVRTAGKPDNPTFLAPEEVTARIFATTLGAVEETVKSRLARPLGTFDRRRPRLTEARRSDRSLKQVTLVAEAVDHLGRTVFWPDIDTERQDGLALAVARVQGSAGRVAELGTLPEVIADRPLRVEVLLQAVEGLAVAIRSSIGAGMGLIEGFNAADGD